MCLIVNPFEGVYISIAGEWYKQLPEPADLS